MKPRDANDIARNDGVAALRENFDRQHSDRAGNGNNRAIAAGRADRNGKKPRIHLVPFNDIRLGKQRRYLVKGLIPRVGLVVVWGPPKSGKSFWVFDVAMHIVLGWEYRGRRVHQGAVVYAAFEGQTGIEARAEAFRRRRLQDHHGDVPFFLEPVTLDLVRDHAALIDVIRRQPGDVKPVAVVLDTLNRSLRGSESNDQDMTAYVNAADAIREAFGCVVIIIHHCGVDGTRPRGHTSLTGATEAQLSVKRGAVNNILVEVECMKDGPEGAKVCSALEVVEVGTDEDGEPITSCIVVPVETEPARPQLKPARMSKPAQIALMALQEAIDECGVTAPASNHIPAGIKVVTEKNWREYAYSRGISTGEARAKQKAFEKATADLIGTEAVMAWDNYVWPAR